MQIQVGDNINTLWGYIVICDYIIDKKKRGNSEVLEALFGLVQRMEKRKKQWSDFGRNRPG